MALGRNHMTTDSLKGIFMPKEEWGVKRVCPETGKRFYDLNNNPVISPYTGEVVPVDNSGKSGNLVADKEDASNKAAEPVDADADAVVLNDDDTTDVDLGDDVLDDDDDTVSLDEIADVPANDDE
jgi:uncharacterized protein (TIGR02300 family)